MATTWTKLRDGTWGVRIEGESRVGATLLVKAKSGKTDSVMVSRIVWSGNGITLAAVTKVGASAKTGRRGECNCGNADDPLSMGFGRYAGRTITCPDCGGRLDCC